MTFNLKYDAAKDPLAAWSPQRRDAAVALIRACDPDVLGLQEVLAGQLQDLSAALEGYEVVGEGRDGGSGGEHAPLFLRRERFALLDADTFWLSSTPEVPSTMPGASLPRICTWAEIADLDGEGEGSGGHLRVWNTHLDHENDALRTAQVAVLLDRLLGTARDSSAAPSRSRPYRTVVMGDLNAPASSSPLRALAAAGRNAREHSQRPPTGPGATFHDWEPDRLAGTGGDHPDRIDHVLASDDLAVVSYDVPLPGELLEAGAAQPSDHHAVVVEIVPS